MARPPIDEATLAERYGPHLKYEPPGGWQRSAGSGGKACADTLLLLWPAMWDSTQGPE